ncbi:hypothetical protein AXG93_1776s1010 [Marchantia polymorpha subsp. ruderalis]|uniref:Uncharacterized protein n=1 Tax=Marchantia polymorpha subsp. ruderalis TaxID=1480154 RepID=A0A176WHV6_MARPO|nr:hypothetical protein AXG93_1776s1010 [Marchantia polymorpha subsp. ruderalis]
MPAMEKCLPSEQVPFDDSPSGQEPSAQAPLAQEHSRKEPSAQRISGQASLEKMHSVRTQLEQVAADEGRKEETCTPSAQASSTEAVRAGEAGPPRASSPTPLERSSRPKTTRLQRKRK